MSPLQLDDLDNEQRHRKKKMTKALSRLDKFFVKFYVTHSNRIVILANYIRGKDYNFPIKTLDESYSNLLFNFFADRKKIGYKCMFRCSG